MPTLMTLIQIVRELRLKHAPDVVVTEEIEAHEAAIVRPKIPLRMDQESMIFSQVYFELSIGTRVTNIISYGPDDELLLTFSFANGSAFFLGFFRHSLSVLNSFQFREYPQRSQALMS
jgi:hypothetical protein